VYASSVNAHDIVLWRFLMLFLVEAIALGWLAVSDWREDRLGR
jgi:hypothetical protein